MYLKCKKRKHKHKKIHFFQKIRRIFGKKVEKYIIRYLDWRDTDEKEKII